MAGHTLRKLFQNLFRMGHTMACLTLRNQTVPVFVAVNTGKLVMLCLVGLQCLSYFLMAGSTVGIGYIRSVGYNQRTVSGMACQTVLHLLALYMGFMTVKTVWNLFVDIVTLGTGKLGMFTGMILQFLTLSLMTGKTRTSYIPGEGNLKRSMRILMTTQTIL